MATQPIPNEQVTPILHTLDLAPRREITIDHMPHKTLLVQPPVTSVLSFA
jgi:hypothetical protein